MPATVARTSQNTYTTGVTGGTVPTANLIFDLSTWKPFLEPVNTPILKQIKKGPAATQRVLNWGASQFTAHKSALATGINNSVTSVVVTTGDGVLFQPNTMLVMYDAVVGSSPLRYDYTTKEEMWVTAVSTDTLTVVRAQGGTTANSHLSTALIEILAPHEAQLQDHSISPVTRGFQYTNYFSRLAGGVKMDNAFRNMPMWENKSDQLVNDVKNEATRLMLLLEKTVVHAGKQAGNPSTPLPEKMGGFLSYITTNVYNQSGATLSIASLETALRDLYNKVDESAKKILVMSANTTAIFDTFLNPYRQITGDATQASFMMDSVKLRWGTYNIMVSRWMPDGVIAITDFSEMQLIPFTGADWHQMDHPVNGDYCWRSISADYSLMVGNERAMGILTNFNTDLTQYTGRNFLT